MKKAKWFLLFVVFALVVAACGGDDDDAGGDDGGETATTSADGEGADLSGTSVSVFGAPTGDEATAFDNTFAVWNEETGGEAVYEGSDSLETQLPIRVDGGNPPDIALLPQPGTICGYSEDLVSLEDMGFDIAALEEVHGSFFIALGECDDGQHYAIPTNANMKSLVWYNKPLFDGNGYTVPETWDDLVALSEQALADGVTPWCIGFGSDAATGWPGTDWIEDIMIRTVGVEGYLDWASNDLPFSSDEVTRAFDLFGEIMFTEGFVLGGADGVAAIDFRDAPDPMFNDPPSCLMHRQANFIVNFFPEGVELGTDTDFFVFPDIDPEYTGAVMGGGELAVVFDARPEVVQFLRDFSGPTYQCVHASPVGDPTLGGNGTEAIERISANAETPIDCYQTDSVKRLAEAIGTALGNDAFAFDGSDIMPAAVGTGSFWTGMVDWSRGASYSDVAATIDASFDQ
jgi:alpha-glucoside transport system substrate-binding protein